MIGLKCGNEKKERLRHIFATPVNRPFSEIHKEIEEIMGRSVWTHELAMPQALYDELDGKSVPSLLEKMLIIRGGEQR